MANKFDGVDNLTCLPPQNSTAAVTGVGVLVFRCR